jgi:hypothetical protein
MAAGSTYTPIATTTLGSATQFVTFSSIGSSYTDLILVVNAAGASTQDMYCQINSDSGSNYSKTILFGNGSTAGSARTSNDTLAMVDYYGTPDSTLGNSVQIIQFMNYSNTSTYKSILSRSSRASGGTDAIVNLWRSTSAITSVQLRLGSSGGANFLTGSTFTLYGILSA